MIDYTVQANDTLWLLSQRFNTSIDSIRSANNLTSDTLRIGQVLRIPTNASAGEAFTIVIDPRPWWFRPSEQYLEHA